MESGRLNVLLVEDNPGDARLIELALSEMLPPCELRAFLRLRDAEPLLRESWAHVVLLDLTLPDVSGIETVQRALGINPSVPVVVLTGHADDQLAQAAMLRGAQDYLVKGQADAEHLARALRYAVQRGRSGENARLALRADLERRQAEASARRFRLLADASRALANSLDVTSVARALAQAAVPMIGHVASVVLTDGSSLHRAAIATGDEHKALEGDLLASPLPPGTGYEAFATGKPVLIDPAPVHLDGGGRYAEIVRTLDVRRVFNVPLIARGRILGVFAVGRSGDERFSAEEMHLLEELGARGAASLDNAILYAREQSSTRARDELIAILSHDLRNPLSVISMAAANLRRSADPAAISKLDRIQRATDGMARLISDLMDVSRLEAGKLQLNREPSEVRLLVDDALDLIRPLASAKSLVLATDAATGLPKVLSERDRVLQVFSNLLGNAVKFTPAGGVVTVEARTESNEVQFAVRDSGPGISEAELPHIFDRFWQARSAGRAGAGLGLAIAKGIVEAHGGRIWAESRPGAGATFHFTLPAA